MEKITLIAGALAVCAPLVFGQTAPAQGGPPAVIQIARETIKEGKGAAHRKVEQDWANTLRRNKYPYHYLGLTVESGPNEALFLSAYASFAEMEESDKLGQKAPLKNDLELLDSRDGEVRSESRTMTAIFRRDLSYLPEKGLPVGKFRYMMIDNYRVRLGQNAAFMQGAKTLIDGYHKANIDLSILCYQVVAGAPSGVYLFLIPLDSLKRLDGMPAIDKQISDAVGSDNLQRLQKTQGEVFQNMESTLFAVSPEMSYLSKEDEDADPAFWRPKPVSAAAKEAPAKQ